MDKKILRGSGLSKNATLRIVNENARRNMYQPRSEQDCWDVAVLAHRPKVDEILEKIVVKYGGPTSFVRAGFPDWGTAILVDGKYLSADSPVFGQIIPLVFEDYQIAQIVAASLGGKIFRSHTVWSINAMTYPGIARIGNMGPHIDYLQCLALQQTELGIKQCLA